jgi:hypothetical protein
MNKLFFLLLCSFLLIGFTSASDNAIGKSYEKSLDTHASYPDTDNLEFTDGILPSDAYDDLGWFATQVVYWASSENITINLGEPQRIYNVSLWAFSYTDGGMALPHTTIWGSNDNVSFTQIGMINYSEGNSSTQKAILGTLTGGIDEVYQYVRYELVVSNFEWVWVGEGMVDYTPAFNCSQETANMSDLSDGNCSLNYNGTYEFDGSGWYPSESGTGIEAIDGNWTTYALGMYDPENFIIINYTKPFYANASSLWKIKNNVGTYIFEIPSACWNADPDKLSFKIQAVYGWDVWGCYDGASYVSIKETTNGEGGGYLYEEAMLWNVAEPEIPEEPEEINLSTGLLHYWNADANYNDLMGTTNSTNYGTSNISGKIKYGWGFDGVNDYVQIGNLTGLDGTTNFTLWMWINATGYGAYDVSSTFRVLEQIPALAWAIAGYSGGKQCFGKVSINEVCSTDAINLSEDTLVSVVYDTDNDLVYFYKNGVADSGGAINYGSTFSWTDGNYAFVGMMDEIGISSVAFTPEMQTQLYNSGDGWTASPQEEPVIPEEPEETGFTSTGQAIFNIMDSSGAGLGIFMIFMGQALPVFLIGFALVVIIAGIGYAVFSFLKDFKVR